jgi:SAM-dependent methyltransferase
MSPAGVWSEERWLECPLFSVGTMQLKDFCKSRQIAKPARLARLLDFKKMERFYRETSLEPSLNQKYSDYRVYNWPAAEPSRRTTLIDCGDLSNVSGVRSIVDEFIRPAQKLGAHARVTGHQEFLSAVAEECKRRAPESVATAMQAQVDAHGYLESIDSNSALREDIREFLGFLPQKLGSTLELGSGTGQLANTLLSRCSYFTCTEIKPLKITALQTVGADVHNLPFRNAVFTTVIANNTLEHLYNPLMCLKEVCRVLVPAGHLYALIPLDGLNPKHQIRTHLWKADEINIRRVIELSGLTIRRMELMNLYDLGINAAFPSCNAWVCKIDAERPGEFE